VERQVDLIHFALNFDWLVNGIYICFVVSFVFGLEMSFDDILWKPMMRQRE